MKTIKLFSILAALVVTALASVAFINSRLSKKTGGDTKGFAVVELYTSEGCSSCPPADDLVAKIQKEYDGKPVYILAFHVDYWDAMGWKDAFSSADYTKRQKEYASSLKVQSGIYTPQIVVNGKTEFVGSQEASLRSAISTNLDQTPATWLTLNVAGVTANSATVKYSIDGDDKKTVLLLALVQKWAKTKVERGENGGHTLSHIQIVRKLQSVSIKEKEKTGTATIELPAGFAPQGWEVIGFLQSKKNGSVTAAAKAEFAAQADAAAMPKGSN